MNKSIKLKNNVYIDGSAINPSLDLFQDTIGTNWQDMMKNKIDYCIANINTNKSSCETFINGGWAGVVYGFGFFSKIGTFYQLLWFSNRETYYCNYDGNYYEYKVLNGNNYQTNEQIIGTWTDGKPIYRKVLTETGDNNNTQIIGFVNDVDTLVKLDVWVENGNNFRNGSTCFYGTINWASQVMLQNNGNIVMESGSEYVGYYKNGATIRTIIEYTKTTD